MTDQGTRNLNWCAALLDGLIAGGVATLVLSPGSRSTPVILAAQRRAELAIEPILDERSAAFYALGLATAANRPVALLATSGSAPAHWLPAVIEAAQSGRPLVLISADRPPELRGWGANQTIEQAELFVPFARECHDPGPATADPAALKMMRALGARAAAVARGPHPGPVHINLPLREPLVPEETLAPPAAQHRPAPPPPPTAWHGGAPDPHRAEQARALLRGRGLICCGPDAARPGLAPRLWQLAEHLGVPVLCDPLSGLRFGPGGPARIARYDGFLRNPRAREQLRPDWVISLGRTPVSKTLLGWLADVPTLRIDPAARWSDPNHDVALLLDADPAACCDWLAERLDPAPRDWLAHWQQAERRIEAIAAEHLAESPWCEPQLLATLLAHIDPGAGLFSANSMPIRQLDTWAGARATPLRLFCNRGASGIDGQASTLAGLNAAGVPCHGLLGDLSLLHDLSGLQLLQRLDRPCVVLNNGGGRIFDYLPQQGVEGFERLWRTPPPLDIGAVARAHGLVHHAVTGAAEFAASLAREDAAGIIEVRIDAERSRAVHQTFWSRLHEDTRLFE
ncbi:2-succinyl-5-enolpyruvyl-6-hydroxy-3-cyclohexene-1-carboxylic-acid synthase [Marichromatium gracile]|uniref:2-succinyl-5-enolpyruvyl-6-hydroxy-3- cyclohexene-1-carboxylic-acid synthase n=1 Tax=Marichromatium gracile TaxID=1048 RepID=UPI001F382479|nr:2-succinyl-5-enolpyruvyl-6-hydroxy-3-cyclohexene-1-carboxylic-acid synthase [Marichromatium gracile]MCF1183342.1 2-succinyl-5-enolpyruvyl-6-hydroxy-3-cyclohexene-1-carboxylic-acid synthase [Marichromatium gracile]